MMCTTPPALVAVIAYGLFAIALFWPVLVGGRVFSAASDLYGWTPWAAHRPSHLALNSNPALSDHSRLFYPWFDWGRGQLLAGHVPQWNPLVLAGTPFLANAETQLFSIFSLPVWLLPFPYGLGVAAAVKLVVASVGAYLFGRQLRLGFLPALTSGLVWGFSPFLIAWLSHSVDAVAVMLPWVLLFAERIAARGRLLDVLGLAAGMAVAFLGGYPEGQAHICLAVVVYVAIRLAATRGLRRRVAARRLALVCGGLLLGGMLASAALLPIVLALPGGVGVAARAGGGRAEGLSALRTIFFPDWWGRPSGSSFGGPDSYNWRDFYAGAIPLMLAAIALLSRQRWRQKLPLAALAVIGVAVPVGVQPARWLLVHVPPFDYARNQLLVMLLDLAVAMLAGFGLDELMKPSHRLRRATIVAAAAVGVGVAGAAAVGANAGLVHRAARHFLTGSGVSSAREAALVSVGWWLVFALAFGTVVILRRRLPATAAVVCILAIVADLGHFFIGYQPMVPAGQVFASTPSIRFLQAHQGLWRVTATGMSMPADTGMFYGLRDIRGKDPPQPSTAYALLIMLGRPTGGLGSQTEVSHLSAVRMRVLDLLSVRLVMTSPRGDLARLPGMGLVYGGPDARIFLNQHAVPPAWIPRTIVRATNDATARAIIAGPGFDPGRTAVTASSAYAGSGSVRVLEDAGGAVLEANMRRAGLVVLTDEWMPGWSVTVDGRPARPVRVDTAVRGVVVSAGHHRIVWTYSTPGLSQGVALSTVAVCVWLGSLGALGLRRRRRSAPVGPTH
jgi:Bacterial membrane protein YfhO